MSQQLDAKTMPEYFGKRFDSKALRVAAQGIPYVALNLEGLAGEKLADVAAVTFDIGVDKAADGKFYAVSGVVYSYTGENADENKADWSVYLEKKNPAGDSAAGCGCAGEPQTGQGCPSVSSRASSPACSQTPRTWGTRRALR